MKKVFLLVFVLFSISYSADAQWYYNACGVEDMNNCTPKEFNCLWNKASKIAHTGAVTTGVGTSLFVLGAIITVASGFGEIAHLTVTLSMVGLLVDIIGAPIWITGSVRKSQLRKNSHFKALNLSSLNISPSIQRNSLSNTYSAGLTVSLSF